jgi:hypothetical protein
MIVSLVHLRATRTLVARQGPGHQRAILHQISRCYSTPRNPEEAEREAATVRGNRAARGRLESHQRTINEGGSAYHEGTKFEGKSFAGENIYANAEMTKRKTHCITFGSSNVKCVEDNFSQVVPNTGLIRSHCVSRSQSEERLGSRSAREQRKGR